MMIDNYSVSESELWWWCSETEIKLTWLRKRNKRYFWLEQLCSWWLELRKYVSYFMGIILYSNTFYPYRTYLQHSLHHLFLLSFAFVLMPTYPQLHSLEWSSLGSVSWTLLDLSFVPAMAIQSSRKNFESFSPGFSTGYVILTLTTPQPHHGSFAWNLPIKKPWLSTQTINGYQLEKPLLKLVSLLRESLG